MNFIDAKLTLREIKGLLSNITNIPKTYRKMTQNSVTIVSLTIIGLNAPIETRLGSLK